jgi:protein phosphatase 1G
LNHINNDTPKRPLNKQDEIKLSPIQKKPFTSFEDESNTSLSSSKNNENNEYPNVDTPIANQINSNKNEPTEEENKENNHQQQNEKDTTNNTPMNENQNKQESAVVAVAAGGEEVEMTKSESIKKALASNKILTKSNLLAKLIANCVNSKLKSDSKKKQSGAKNDQEEEDKDEDEDDDLDDDSEEEESEEDEEDGSEEEASDDEDDDDDDEDEEYEDEDEDEDEEEDYDSAQGMGMESRPGFDSGCTAVVALLKDNKHLYVANAGDSRCVVCREGRAVDMSVDHKPEDDSERARIEKAGGHVTKDGRVNNGLNLSRAIGDHSYKKNSKLSLSEQMITSLPDLYYLEIDPQKDKFMVLACDGIWNFMSSQEVCDYISERLNANYTKVSQIIEELFMHCLAPNTDGDGTGCDNMTCIVVTFKPFRQYNIKLNALQPPPQLLVPQNVNNNNLSCSESVNQKLIVESEKVASLKRTLENGNEENIEIVKTDLNINSDEMMCTETSPAQSKKTKI